MTAINLFKTADAACILTDQAWVSDGKLTMIVSKVVAEPKLQMAIAASGNVTVRTRSIIRTWLEANSTQAQAMGQMGDLLDLVRTDAADDGHGDDNPAKLFIALWHPQLAKPEVYIADTALVSVSRCEGPPSALPVSDPADKPALIARIEDQRRQATNIGAAAELTLVTAHGITSEIIHRWPDRLGQPITP